MKINLKNRAKELREKLEVLIDKKINVQALENGIQVSMFGIKLTFYYRSFKYNNSQNRSWDTFKKDQELEICHGIFMPLVVERDWPKPMNVNELTEKGTRACIDHIKRKLETFKKVNPGKEGNQTATMLLNLTLELEQYL